MPDHDPANSSKDVLPSVRPQPELRGLDPGELLARGLDTAKPSGGASAWEPPTPEELSRLLAQYRVESLIGRGGMGAVYKATQIVLDRPVAIKLLPAEIAADEQFIARFHREARTLARLQHSRIITIHDFGQTSEGHLYFVMEYIDGTDLRKILRGPGLSSDQALLVVGQICDALHAAHSQGVIHRDIKPENILVTKDGYVKLADFGLARLLCREDTTVLTGTNVIMGTADYMAPEQREGQSDERADIFALGVMLYEMLTGHTPRGAFEPASRKMQLDVRIDEVVLRALQAEPERRYQHVSEMKTDVERIRNTPLPAPPPAKPLPAAKLPRPAAPQWRNSKAVLFMAVICIILLGIAAGYFIWQRSGHPSSDAGPVPPAGGGAAAPGHEDTQPARPPSPSRPLLPFGPATAANPAAATEDAPFVNSLGMKFVPVPILGGPTGGRHVLFSVWDSRVQDYEVFVKETRRSWPKPNFEQGSTHPAANLTWDDAQAFCQWLTGRERAAGRLPVEWRYRLPSDHEWSCAAGIGEREDAAKLPAEKDRKIDDAFPWGTQWPPPSAAGNYRGQKEGFVNTSPVGSFSANQFGLFDMGGNVWQWCEDWFDKDQKERVLRDASWNRNDRDALLSSFRSHSVPGSLHNGERRGFRCVVDPAISALPTIAAPAQNVSSTPADAGAHTPSATPPPPPNTAAEKDTLEKALLSHAWTWTPGEVTGIHVPIPENLQITAFSTGFEAPQFQPGPLEGQSSHFSVFPDGKESDTASAVRIVGDIRQNGNQAVLVSAGPANKIQTGIRARWENSAKVVHFQADVFLNRSLRQTPWQFAAGDDSASGWFVGGFNIAPVDRPGELITTGYPEVAPVVSREKWRHVEIIYDVRRQVFSIVLDGVAVSRDVPFVHQASRVRCFQFDTFANGDDSAYFDNFSVTLEP